MPITLTQLAGNTASITLTVGEDTVTVDYYPGKVTEKTFALAASFSDLTDLDSIQASFTSLNELLVSLIKDWDVYEDDASTQKFPLVVDRMSEIPYMFRVNLLTSILGDIRPNVAAL